ncbi:uncharacterized protein LOC131322918 isoform X2 [Rhododendron vialii]|uniref:uncharacterized protein LOC131322918 isoform X2 n=1 Tax=Rhododendron vialii TaxID=182163 RepID=UPI00265ED470|nr:uncharacterized protein LOC131322918 isoform X2 [Rhododendron vialii]
MRANYDPREREILMLVNKNGLVEYNPKLGSFKNLNIYGIKSEFYAAGHIPSFVPLPDVAKGERLTKNCLRPRMSALTRLEIALQKIVDSCCESSLRSLPVVPTMEECMAKLSSMPQFSQNNEMRVKCRSLFADSDHRALFMACPDDERRYYFIHQACPVTIKECMAKLSSIPEFSRNSELWARGANLFRHSNNRALFMACPNDEKSCYFIMHGIAEEAEQRNNNSGLHSVEPLYQEKNDRLLFCGGRTASKLQFLFFKVVQKAAGENLTC